MTVPTLQQLMTPVTQEQERLTFLTIAAALGLDVDNWPKDGVASAVAEYSAAVSVANNANTVAIAQSGHLDTAHGIGLDLWALSQYQELRRRASKAEWVLSLSAGQDAPVPQTFQPQDLVAIAPNGTTYRNTTGGTLIESEPLSLTWQAEDNGLHGNLAGVAREFTLQTPIPGVVILPPAGDATVAGVDDERDSAFRERCRTKWASLGQCCTEAGLEWQARTASPIIDRVQVDTRHNAAAGDVTVYVASAEGPVSTQSAIDDAQNFIMGSAGDETHPPLERRAAYGAEVHVVDATPMGGEGANLSCKVTMLAQYATDIDATKAKLRAALDAYLSTVPIGGKQLNPLEFYDGTLPLGDLFAALKAVPGVQNASFSSLGGDKAMVAGEVATAHPDTDIQIVRL